MVNLGYAHDRLTTAFWAVPNMFVVVILVLCIYPGWLARRSIPGELFSLAFLALTAFAASALVSAYARQFFVLIPLLTPLVAFVVFSVVRIEVRREKL